MDENLRKRNASQVEEVFDILGHRRQPPSERSTVGLPTWRFGESCVVHVMKAEGYEPDSVVEPDIWVATDYETGRLLGYTHTVLASPLASDWREIGRQFAGLPAEQVHPRDMVTVMRDLTAPIRAAFVEGAKIATDDKARYENALRTFTDLPLQPWLFACCDDFMSWLTNE